MKSEDEELRDTGSRGDTEEPNVRLRPWGHEGLL